MQAAILLADQCNRSNDAVNIAHDTMLRDVLGRPFIEHVMRNLRRFGFNRFLLLAGNKGESVHERYSAGSAFAREIDADIRVLVEPEPLGTAGALKFAAPELAEEFLLLNGDSLFDFNYLDLTHCTRPGEPGDWLARVALLPAENADRCGFVQLNGCSISPLREKPAQPESGLVNSGVYWLRSDILEWIDQLPCSLEQDIFPRLAAANALVGRAYQGFFIDISSPGDPERAGRELECALRKPAVFLDRDGTLNHDAGYTHRVADFHWVAGATTAIRALNDAGYLVFIVTNQAGIARGYYDARAVAQLHAWMQAELRQLGAHIDDLRYCPHHPEGSVADLAITCDCRKPATGMLDSLIAQWQPDLTRSFMLGDAAKDAAAGNAAGVTGRQVATGDILGEVQRILGQ